MPNAFDVYNMTEGRNRFLAELTLESETANYPKIIAIFLHLTNHKDIELIIFLNSILCAVLSYSDAKGKEKKRPEKKVC